MTTDTIVPLTTQVRQALEQFTATHEDAERRIAAAATLKMAVGANESDRKAQKAAIAADEYAGYVASLAEAEKAKAAAVASLERREKELNVLRELLQRESAEVHMRAADRYHQAVTIADTTAQRYAVMPGNYTTHAEFRARYPIASDANGIKRATVAVDDDPDSLLPF